MERFLTTQNIKAADSEIAKCAKHEFDEFLKQAKPGQPRFNTPCFDILGIIDKLAPAEDKIAPDFCFGIPEDM